MNKNEMMAKMAKHIEDDLHNAARFIAGEVYDMLCTYEQTMIDKVLEIIDGCKFSYKEDEVSAWDGIQWHNRALEQAKQAVEALRGEQDE